ncbi:hypothetical protein HID58_070859 [Brassica napus]|uniref:Uncharacterized protein n=1 Tax=Brassica napus TaxID=3708 RepID=A0ABQ7YZX2_BRANA|nr:hypothetical protein HID58_070859 [Brassica napus]
MHEAITEERTSNHMILCLIRMINDDLHIALCERNSDKKLIKHQDEDWNEIQVRPISEILAAVERSYCD